jgi:hypothetical protein
MSFFLLLLPDSTIFRDKRCFPQAKDAPLARHDI